MTLTISRPLKVVKKNNYICFSAEVCIEFENIQDEVQSDMFEFPEDWKTKCLSKINMKDYDFYSFVSKTMQHGCHNVITDKKKIWGLYEINSKNSIFDCAYESSNGKTYLGILRNKSIFQNGCGILILIPKGNSFPVEPIITALINKKYEIDYLKSKLYDEFLASLQNCIPNSILLNCSISQDSIINLSIYAKNVEKIF